MPDVWIAVEWMADKLTFNEIQHALPQVRANKIGMNLLNFLILPVRVIRCSLAAMPQAGWRSSNILVDTSHMSIRSQKKCRNMFEGVDIVDIWFLCQVVRNCVAACLRGVSPQLGSLVACRLGGSVLLIIYCIIINNVSFMYGDMKTVSLSKCSTDKTPQIHINCIYIVEEALRMLSKCFVVNWPIFVDAMVSPCSPKLLRSSKTMQKHPSPLKTSCAQSGVIFAHRYWHFGLGSHMLFQAYVFCWAFGLVGVI